VAVAAALCLLACGPSDTPDQALKLLESRETDAALGLLRSALADAPGDPELNHLYGLALLQNQQAALAAWPLRRAAQSPDHAVKSGLALAQVLLLIRNGHDAIQACDAVLELEPDNFAALRLRQRAYMQTNREEEALEDVERLIEQFPDALNLAEIRLTILLRLGRVEDAEAALESLTELARGRDDVEDEAFAHLCARAARIHSLKLELEAAEERVGRCLEEHPGNVEVLREAVRFYHGTRRPDRATQILVAAAQAEPEALGLQTWLAARYQQLGRADEAERVLHAAAERIDTVAAWTALRNHYVAEGDLDGAEEAIDRALQASAGIHPGEPGFSYDAIGEEKLFEYADVLVQLGAYERTARMLEHIREPAFRQLLEARMLYEKGDVRGALDRWEEAFRLWPANPGGRYLAARAALDLREWDRATSHLRESLRAGSEATDAGIVLAKLQLAQGHTEAAFDALHHHLKGHPDDVEMMRMQAVLAARTGRDELSRDIRVALANQHGKLAQALGDQARDVALQQGYAAGLDFLEASAEIDLAEPQHVEALRAWWELMLALGRAEEARDRIAGTAAQHPEAAEEQALYAAALIATSQHAEARAALERALAADAECVNALLTLAGLEVIEGHTDPAVAAYDRVAALEPDKAEPAVAAGAQLVSAGRVEEGRARLEAALANWPWRGDAANSLALLALERGDLDPETLALAEQATRFIATSGPLAFETLGRVRLARGDATGAVEALRSGVAAGATGASIQYQLGRALAKAGDSEQAVEAFEAALAFEGFDQADAAREELARLRRTPEG
jgi:tetratricopeptide (TPR) repeat protein